MSAVRQGAGRGGTGPLLYRRSARQPRLRLPASGIELGYIALTAAFAAILGVAVASLAAPETLTTPESIAPAPVEARSSVSTTNAATTGTGRNTGGPGGIAGVETMDPTLIHNLGARSAVTSAIGRF